MRALVTGGGGFLGTALCRTLTARGDEVRSISRGDYPHLAQLGVQVIRADLADVEAISKAAEGCDAVFHVAAKAGVWGREADYIAANVTGSEHVLEACRAANVARLVYTSSPSVCFDGSDHLNASNDLPRATSFLAPYPRTKAIAEERVLAANSPELATCALRPHLIFGPGDPHILPRLIARARSGRLRIVGEGTNEVTVCFVENAAHAHVLAADTLRPGAPHAGKAYFIGQQAPVQLWKWINELLEAVDVAPVRKHISRGAAYKLGAVLESTWRLLRLAGEPPMTRFVATQLATSHSYDMQPASRDFGYTELVSSAEALARTVESLRA